jgi:pantetheine-phosphate adenylyltransferase
MAEFRRGLLTLSADPIHRGHTDIIKRARDRCETLVVYVTNNDLKRGSYLFDIRVRERMTAHALQVEGIENVEVISGDELLVDVYLRENCDAVFRGVRTEEDRLFEEQQMQHHNLVLPGFASHVVYLEALGSRKTLSSSVAKAMADKHIDVAWLVPTFVKAMLAEKLHGQYFVGITGQMGVGKTFVAQSLADQLRSSGYPTHLLNIDELVRTLYDEDSRGAQGVRDQMVALLGDASILIDDGRRVDREALKAVVATADGDVLAKLHNLTAPHVNRLMRQYLRHRRGLIVVEWALLIENELTHLCNHHVLIVDSPDQDTFLDERGVPADVRERFLAEQWDADKKQEQMQRIIETTRYGRIKRVTNQKSCDVSGPLEAAMLRWFPGLERLRRS